MSNDNYLDAVITEDKLVPEIVEDTKLKGAFTAKLTRKQKAFVKELVDNPKRSATEAVSRVYDVGNRDTARSMAAENLAKPSIIMALGEHAQMFESAIVGVVNDWGASESTRKREIALDAAKFGHDKIFGKATVTVHQQTEIVSIAINLTGDGEAPPDELLDKDE
jgi:hypothetical protein